MMRCVEPNGEHADMLRKTQKALRRQRIILIVTD